jgi:hypothetical protein
MPAFCQSHSESQQNDREYEQSDDGQAIIALPKVNDEHHYYADDWQQNQHRDPDGDDAHIAQDRQTRRAKPRVDQCQASPGRPCEFAMLMLPAYPRFDIVLARPTRLPLVLMTSDGGHGRH